MRVPGEFRLWLSGSRRIRFFSKRETFMMMPGVNPVIFDIRDANGNNKLLYRKQC